MKPVDIIILAFQRLSYLKVLIKELEKRTSYPYRLIIVDNGSTDGTRKWVRKQHRKGKVWKYVFTEKNLPMTDAFTAGFKEVESEYFITTQDDIIPPKAKPCWLTEMVRLIKEHPEYASITMGWGPGNFIKYLKREYGWNGEEMPPKYLHINRPDNLKWVVSAAPRSGTDFISRLFSSVGMVATHEKVFSMRQHKFDSYNLPVVDVSWYVAPYLWKLKEQNITIVHLIRNPLDTIASLKMTGQLEKRERRYNVKQNFIYYHFPELHPDTGEIKDEIERCMYFWVVWNKMIEKYADYRFKIEDINKNKKGFFKKLGIEIKGEKFYNNMSCNWRNTAPDGKKKINIVLEDIKEKEYFGEFMKLAKEYGYKF